MLQDQVADEEILYRCVKRGYVRLENGEAHVSSQAFLDPFPRCRISVDRAALCNNDPAHTQVEATDLICQLLTLRVKSIGTVVQRSADGKQIIEQHNVRVEPEFKEGNPAHAVIFAAPQVATKGVFRKLQEGLAQIAEWSPGFGPADNLQMFGRDQS